MLHPVVTRSIHSTEPPRWAFAPELQERRRAPLDVRPTLRAIDDVLRGVLAIVGIAAIFAACAILIFGCAGGTITAHDVLDASAIAARAEEESLAARHRAAERVCLELETTDGAAACLDRVEGEYATAWGAYGIFLAAWHLGDAAERAGAADAMVRALAAERALGGTR